MIFKDRVRDLNLLDALCEPLIDILVNRCRSRRDCDELPDADFFKLGVLRVIESSRSGREFLQWLDGLLDRRVPRATYFKALESSRRQACVRECSTELFWASRQEFLELGSDAFAEVPQLAGYDVFAIDGHHREHGTHAPRDGDGEFVSENTAYLRCVRTGMCEVFALIQGQGIRAHELPRIREEIPAWLEQRRQHGGRGTPILVLDAAYIDLEFWSRRARPGKGRCEMIVPMRDDMRPLVIEERSFEAQDPMNLGVISDQEVWFTRGERMRLVTYRDPETGTTYRFITTNRKLPPGLIAWLYLLRWGIEKTYDTGKNKCGQKKGWVAHRGGQETQSHFMAMTQNLLRLMEARLDSEHGIRERKVEEKWKSQLEERKKAAAKRGGEIHPLILMGGRIAQLTCQFIRALRFAISAGKTFLQALPKIRKAMASYL